MKRGDFLWLAVLGIVSSIMLVPVSHQVFVGVTKAHPYGMGFVKFAILATMGELMTIRIVAGAWRQPPGLAARVVIWGIIGMIIVLAFEIFSSGVLAAISKGLLWSAEGSKVWAAFLISAMTNLIFAPVFMTFHRVTDTYIDVIWGENKPFRKIALAEVVGKIDWQGLISFVICKTIPYFWIPAHTITFLLPPEYRVLMAAYLSIALGAFLAYGKRRTNKVAAK